jgi:hypothetical protein
MNSHSYLFRVIVVDRFYTILEVCILKLKLHQVINTMEWVINFICSIVSVNVMFLKITLH